MLEHDPGLTRLHRLLVLIAALLGLLLLVSVEGDLALELLIDLLVLVPEMNFYLLEDGALAYSRHEGLSADISPQLLVVIGFGHLELI